MFYLSAKKANLKNINLKDKTILITGASDGIGVTTAEELAKLGATIIFACRSFTKTMPIIEKIQKETGNLNVRNSTKLTKKLEFLKLDLSDFKSIEDCIKNLNSRKIQLDIVINNAACVVDLSKEYKTKDGFEMMFGVNYLGHYFLNRFLINQLIKTKGRLVIVSSEGHEFVKEIPEFIPEEYAFFPLKNKGYVGTVIQYGLTKLFNNMHKNEMHKRFHQEGITVNALHPGKIATNLAGENWQKRLLDPLMYLFFWSPLDGCQTTLHVACSPELKNVSGKYFSDVQMVDETKLSKDEKYAEILWNWSEKQCCEKSEFFKQAFQK
jgi:NAD(P)-dependent dehydrogenase (short-subunit alcohol dehydrogenase family)